MAGDNLDFGNREQCNRFTNPERIHHWNNTHHEMSLLINAAQTRLQMNCPLGFTMKVSDGTETLTNPTTTLFMRFNADNNTPLPILRTGWYYFANGLRELYLQFVGSSQVSVPSIKIEIWENVNLVDDYNCITAIEEGTQTYMRYITRGAYAAPDFTQATLTLDDTFWPVDLSTIITDVNAKMVHLAGTTTPDQLFISGSGLNIAVDQNVIYIAGVTTISDGWVILAPGRIIYVQGTAGSTCELSVRGWII